MLLGCSGQESRNVKSNTARLRRHSSFHVVSLIIRPEVYQEDLRQSSKSWGNIEIDGFQRYRDSNGSSSLRESRGVCSVLIKHESSYVKTK